MTEGLHDEFGAVLPPGHSSGLSMPPQMPKNQRQFLGSCPGDSIRGFRLGQEDGTMAWHCVPEIRCNR